MLVKRVPPRYTVAMRRGRALALLLVAILMVGSLGACNTGDSERDLAAQDKLVQLGNRLAATHARIAQARRLVARERRVAALLAARRQGLRRQPPRPARVVQTGFSFEKLCGRIPRGRDREARVAARQLERQRKEALYYLNLSCPPVRT